LDISISCCVGDLSQRLLEDLGRLTALDQVLPVDHDVGHRLDAGSLPLGFDCAHLSA